MQTLKVQGVATNTRHENGDTIIRYHQTDVVRFNDKQIILNTGGWFTNTTKLRMNQASHQYGLGFGVCQEKGAWYISRDGWKNKEPFGPGDIHVILRTDEFNV